MLVVELLFVLNVLAANCAGGTRNSRATGNQCGTIEGISSPMECAEGHALDEAANACRAPPSFQCEVDKLVTIGSAQACTQCKQGFAPIDGVCTAFGDDLVTKTAKCTQSGGAAIEGTDTSCGKCGGDGYFLFMGGCYKTGASPGELICTNAVGGVCAACKADGSVFQNKASVKTPGSECILCSDSVGADSNKGVANCAACDAPTGDTGTAKCKACAEGHALDEAANACRAPPSFQCEVDKLVTIGSAQACTQCKQGFAPIDGVCTAFGDDLVTKTAKCTQSGGAAIEGTDTSCGKCGGDGYFLFMGGCYKTGASPGELICTNAVGGVCAACKADGSVFQNKASVKTPGSECILCSDSVGADSNKGVANCAACDAPTGDTGTAKCKACAEGHALDEAANACRAPPSFQCEVDKLVTIGSAQACTQCKQGFAPIDGVCTAFGDDLVTKTAKCTQSGGAAIEGTDTSCGKCGGDGYFLFMGGCYKTGASPGELICTNAVGGVCAACKADGSVFQNKASVKTPGSECILCSDSVGADSNKGVANCAACDAPTGDTGTAKCKACAEGHALDEAANACRAPPSFQCEVDKLVTIGSAQACTQCKQGFAPIDGVCTAFGDDLVTKTAKCTQSGGAAIEGTDTSCGKCGGDGYFLFMGGCYKTGASPGELICTNAVGGVCAACKADGSVFQNKASVKTPGSECILCSDSVGADSNKGVANCAACDAPTGDTGTAKCKACAEGHALDEAANACRAPPSFQCEVDKLVTIGSAQACTQCKQGFAPIDGVCTAFGDDLVTKTAKCTQSGGAAIEGTDTSCGKCGGDGYFLFMGGCYKTGASPGELICTNAVGGVCAACKADGSVFQNKASVKTPGSECILCSDSVGADSNKGVANCAACDAPTGDTGTAKCKACAEGHALDEAANACRAPPSFQCEVDKLVTIGSAQACTQCKQGFAPIDGVCTAFGDDLVTKTAKCTQSGGAAIEGTDTSCGKCGGDGYFLFMGGCYKTGASPGELICTNAVGGVCAACKADGSVFQNKASVKTPGSECILCSDSVGADSNKGVANCAACDAPTGDTGTAKCKACAEGHALDEAANACRAPPSFQCEVDKLVTIGSAQACTQCKQGFAPIDGVCTAFGDDLVTKTAKCTQSGGAAIEGTDTSCGKCGGDGYFLFMGGCYKTGASPGELICTNAVGGVCAACKADGSVFQNKASVKTPGSECILCSDSVGADSNKGVANCAACDAPTGDTGTAKCKACAEGHALDEAANACRAPPSFQCEVDKLVTIGSAQACTQCKQGFAPIDGVCTAFGDDLVTKTAKCTQSGGAAIEGTDTSCGKCGGDGYFLFMGGCYKTGASPGELICTNAVGGVCAACKADGSVFQNKASVKTPGSECILCSDSVGADSNKGVANCAACDAPTGDTGTAKCKACAEGHALDEAANACRAPPSFQCEVDKLVTIGSAQACTQCKQGFAPIDGVCTAFGDDLVTKTAKCTQSGGAAIEGTDTSCGKCGGDGYFLFMGGCYKTGASPGELICTNAVGGVCAACKADGSVFQNKASVKTPGSECILCSDSVGADSNKGVANCAACDAPTGDTGTAKCKACAEGHALDEAANACVSSGGAGGSVNKGGLSTGAIAGITVAVVVVVGGLAGFLCWWFICRGKA